MTVNLVARNVQFRYRPDAPFAVMGANLEVFERDAVGIVGESGSGKSTFCRLLAGALTPTVGDVLIGSRPWQEVSRRDPLRRSVQMVFQEPYGSLNPRLSARETVAEVIRHWDKTSRREASRRAGESLREVGLAADAIDRRPGNLSGGQCQRVGIARALACRPSILIADEPTSALDVSVQAQILNLLLDLQATHGLTLILVSHDLAVVRYATKRAVIMYDGCIVEEGTTDQLLSAPSHPYTRILVDSIPGNEGPLQAVENDIESRDGCVFAPRCPFVTNECLSSRPPLTRAGDRLVACLRPTLSTTSATSGGGTPETGDSRGSPIQADTHEHR